MVSAGRRTGYAEAQSSLAAAYFLGLGVGPDPAKAVYWARLAAEQGEPRAHSTVGLSYARGEGVSADPIEAIKWFDLAATQGYMRALTNREEVIANFGVTPAGLVEAKRRASQFVPKPTPATLELPPSPLPKAFASGFFITKDGYLLTCFHVLHVAGASRLEVKTRDGVAPATLVRSDPANDLALLKVSGTFSYLPLAPSGSVRLGEPVFTIGFPNPDWQGLAPKLTRGEISSLMGFRDDPRQFQISVAMQPGNSGGPLVDERGNVVGILMAQANESLILHATGTLPQRQLRAQKRVRPGID